MDEVPEVVGRGGVGRGVVAHLTARPRSRRDVTVHDEALPAAVGCLSSAFGHGPRPPPSQIPGRTTARSRHRAPGHSRGPTMSMPVNRRRPRSRIGHDIGRPTGKRHVREGRTTPPRSPRTRLWSGRCSPSTVRLGQTVAHEGAGDTASACGGRDRQHPELALVGACGQLAQARSRGHQVTVPSSCPPGSTATSSSAAAVAPAPAAIGLGLRRHPRHPSRLQGHPERAVGTDGDAVRFGCR